MGADDAHSDPALHITAIRTWHQAAMVVIVVRQTDQIQMSAQNVKYFGARTLLFGLFLYRFLHTRLSQRIHVLVLNHRHPVMWLRNTTVNVTDMAATIKCMTRHNKGHW